MKRGRKNPHEERGHLLHQAQAHMTRGAACLLDAHQRDKAAEALIWAGLAALRIAQADDSREIRDRANVFIDEMKKRCLDPAPTFAGANPGVGL